MKQSRRKFLNNAGALGATTLLSPPSIVHDFFNKYIGGVRLGVITYSFRDMPDQSIEAILQYVKDCGITEIELMGDSAELYAGKPANPVNMREAFPLMRLRMDKKPMTDDQIKHLAEIDSRLSDYRKSVATWRSGATMAPFEKIKSMFNDSGIKIYAFKPDAFGINSTDGEKEFGMMAAKTLGANQITLEHPGDDGHTLKLGTLASKHKIYVGYHGHEQQTPTFWDKALAQSPYNALNLDLGHYIAAGHTDAIDLINKHNQRIVSMHIKDRQNPAHGKGNLVWGTGDTPIGEALKTMRTKRYGFPATIELEYKIPEGSNAVLEVKKCMEFAKGALMS